jgi:hypothetical protein
MKINVSYFRIGLLVLNLVCAISLPAYAVYRYKATTEVTSVTLVEPRVFEYSDKDGQGVQQKGPQRIAVVPELWIQKQTPAEGSDVAKIPRPEDTAPGPTTPDELQPGPLADKWEYYWCIVFPENPLLNRVLLKQKDAAGVPAMPGGSTRTPGVKRTVPRQRVTLGKKGAGMPQQAGDTISFVVGDREYPPPGNPPQDDLWFRIHSADAQQFVYSLPVEFKEGQPPRKYALKRVPESRYLQDPEEGLRPLETPEATSHEGGEEKPQKKIIKRSQVFESTREKDFKRYEEGQKPLSEESFGRPEPASPDAKAAAGSAAGAAAKATPSARKTIPSFKKADPVDRRGPNEDEKKQLKEALQKMSPEEKRQIQEAMMGAPKG